MKKIQHWIDIQAKCRFEIEKPENWDYMSISEKKRYFYSNCELVSKSTKNIQIDFQNIQTDFSTIEEKFFNPENWDISDFIEIKK